MLSTLALVTKAGWQHNKKLLFPGCLVISLFSQKMDERNTESNTYRWGSLRHKHQSCKAEEQQVMRSHPAMHEWALWWLLSRRAFYTHFSPVQLLIPAKLTPNLLILIIDLVNKRRISNPHKYEPCLERLGCQNISFMKYSNSSPVIWSALWSKQRHQKYTKIFSMFGQNIPRVFHPFSVSMQLFHFLDILFVLGDDG